MPGENESTEGQTAENATPPTTTNAAPPAATPASANGTRRTDQVVTMPQATLGKLKREAAEKAERRAAAKREEDAKTAGFASYDAMVAAAAEGLKAKRNGNGKATAKPAETPATETAPTGATVPRKEFDRMARDKAALEDKVKTLSRDRQRLERLLKDAKHTLADQAGTYELKAAAMRAGIVDVDYAVHLVKARGPQRQEGEASEAYYKRLEEFDEDKFFAGLREDPKLAHLFGEERKPANTGNAGLQRGPTEAPPKAGTKPAEPTPTKSSRDVPQDEFEKALAKHGLQNPATGSY